MVLSKTLKLALALLAAVALLCLVAVAGLWWLAGSDRGSALLAGQVQQRLGDDIQWRQFSGSLLGAMTVNGVTISQPGLEASLERLQMALSPAALLRGELLIDSATVQGVDIVSTASDSEPATGPFLPGSLPLPVDVTLQRLAIQDISWRSGNGPPLLIDSVSVAAAIKDRALRIDSLTVAAPGGRIALRGDVVLRNDMPVDINAEWSGSVPLAAGAAAELAGNAVLNGDLAWGDTLAFDLAFGASAEGLQALDAELPDALALDGDIEGSQGDNRAEVRRLQVSLRETALSFLASGKVSGLDQPAPRFEGELAWRALRWPLMTDPILAESANGKLAISGSTEAYELTVNAALAGQDIPLGQWQLQGSGDTTQLQIAALRGQLLDGEVNIRGPVHWQPAPRWTLQIDATRLNPAALTELPGQLSLALETSGQLQADGEVQALIDLQALSGELMGYPVAASAVAEIAGERITLQQLRAQSDDNSLAADGHLEGDALALRWQADINNPGALLEGATGAITAQGELAGTISAPLLSAEISGGSLALDNLQLESLALRLQSGIELQSALAIDLSTGELRSDGEALAQALQLQVDGTLGQHRLRFQGHTASETLSLGLSGGLGTELSNWRGTVTGLDLASEQLGSWQLRQGGALALSAQEASLANTCLEQQSSSAALCTAAAWQADGDSTLVAKLQALPLQGLLDTASGSVSANIDAAMDAQGMLRASGAIDLSPGVIQVDTQAGLRQLHYAGGVTGFRIDNDGLQADTSLGLPEQGRVSGNISLPNLKRWPLPAQQPLKGQLKANIPELEGLAAWLPDVSAAAGSLDADLALAGSLEQPAIAGEVALRNGAADIPMAGLKLRRVSLLATSDPDTTGLLDIAGSAASGDGQLQVKGSVNLDTQSADVALQGESFTVYNTADARVAVSPDLAISWLEDTLRLRGDIRVPAADITPQIQLSPAALAASPEQQASSGQRVAPSADVVVINRSVEPPPDLFSTAAPFRIDSQVRLVLGDAVKVNAVGFRSQITGAVTFTNSPDQADIMPTARGRLALEGGTFRSFGQDLQIENGQIIFADVAASEPELNIRAVRWIDNDPQVTAAGVSITGTVQEPVLELFSRPQLPASEIQSYLLTGRSPRSRDNVLSLGTYISPRIYVGYGYNMVQDTSEFNSLFTITPRYGVSANVGEADNNINATFTYEH